MTPTSDLRSTQPLDMLPVVFPWIKCLPVEGRIAFVHELIDVESAAESHYPVTPPAQLITEWRDIAQVHADPELLEILRSPLIEDAGEVPGPTSLGNSPHLGRR